MQFHIANAAAAPCAPPASLTQFVRTDFSFDIPAIKAAAKANYGKKLNFINSFSGAPKLFWQRSIARRVIAAAWREAREQRHSFIWAQLPLDLPFTPAERKRREVLRVIIASAAINSSGNADHREACAEYGAIGQAAQRRAYDAILASRGVA